MLPTLSGKFEKAHEQTHLVICREMAMPKLLQWYYLICFPGFYWLGRNYRRGQAMGLDHPESMPIHKPMSGNLYARWALWAGYKHKYARLFGWFEAIAEILMDYRYGCHCVVMALECHGLIMSDRGDPFLINSFWIWLGHGDRKSGVPYS